MLIYLSEFSIEKETHTNTHTHTNKHTQTHTPDKYTNYGL